jgi:hypothetical protein
MNLPAGLPIPQEDWDKTPLSVQAVVIALWQKNQMHKRQLLSSGEYPPHHILNLGAALAPNH